MLRSIKGKIIVVFSLLIIVSGILIGFTSYQSSKALVEGTINKQYIGIVEGALSGFDLKRYEEISASSGETPYYHELREQLNEIRESNNFTYLYTMARVETDGGHEYQYMVDGMPQGAEEASGLGDVEEAVEEFPGMVKAFETGTRQSEMSVTEEYGALATVYVPIKSTEGQVIGILGADIDVTDVYSSLKKMQTTFITIILVILSVSVIIVYFFGSTITKPLKQLSQNVQAVGGGDLTTEFTSKRKDEIGQLTKAFNQMLSNLKMMIRNMEENAAELEETKNTLSFRANETKLASEEIAATMELISADSTLQYNRLENSVHVVKEMSQGLHYIAQASVTAAELSESTLSEVADGNGKLLQVTSQMDTIHHSVTRSAESLNALKIHANEISSIVTIIRNIAAQTNLLALNAAIEAARAGDAGKGFAVVAAEVRKLAEQSEASTESIQELIDRMNSDTINTVDTMDVVKSNVDEGLLLVKETEQVFKSIVSAMEGVTSQIQEVTSTSEELYSATEEINHAASENSKIAETAAASTRDTVDITNNQKEQVTEIAANIEGLARMSEQLKELTSRFKM
ncbi:methyl-accepting chemotaxis protein [Bacillus sp. SG-1]|uniref:methyl-accepting chemotaxis protein n=1 Tax=Bacillus sp. SG-1 TaxID=161544 RepID=UPI000154458A|nr:methyl-accepting chemotaxis protein [Bacillus sp. SG-1]EDL63845.1 methyl-accepting chemotaxis protein [Bacillus sp. SG-1]